VKRKTGSGALKKPNAGMPKNEQRKLLLGKRLARLFLRASRARLTSAAKLRCAQRLEQCLTTLVCSVSWFGVLVVLLIACVDECRCSPPPVLFVFCCCCFLLCFFQLATSEAKREVASLRAEVAGLNRIIEQMRLSSEELQKKAEAVVSSASAESITAAQEASKLKALVQVCRVPAAVDGPVVDVALLVVLHLKGLFSVAPYLCLYLACVCVRVW